MSTQLILPTPAARSIAQRFKLDKHFGEFGRESSSAWREVISGFQRMILSGTDLVVAREVVHVHLKWNPDGGEDQNDELIKQVINPALEKIESVTMAELSSHVADNLIDMSMEKQYASQVKGADRIEALRMLKDLLGSDKAAAGEKMRGLIIKMTAEPE